MALRRDTFGPYVGRWTVADSDHPQGGFKNFTTPGNGSFLHQDWVNDWDAFFSSLLGGFGDVPSITPNENVDAVGSSQYFDQLIAIITSAEAKAGDIVSSANTDIITRGYLPLEEIDTPNNVSRTTYASLFAQIGTSFGVGDGSTTFGLPAKAPLLAAGDNNVGDWVQLGDYSSDTSDNVTAIAVNSSNGDVWVCSGTGNNVYKQAGGVGLFVNVNNYSSVGSVAIGIAVNSSNGDVWVCDDTASPGVFKSVGGTLDFVDSGLFSIGPDSQIRDIAVNSLTGDVWLVSTANDVMFSKEGTNPFVTYGSYPATNAIGISVNELTGDVFILDASGTIKLRKLSPSSSTYQDINVTINPGSIGISTSPHNNDIIISDVTGTSEITRVRDNKLTVIGALPSGTYPGAVAVNKIGDIFATDSLGDQIYKLAGSPAIKWYIKT